MANKNQYRITIEPLPGNRAPAPAEPLQFVARCHDDLLAIVERIRQRGEFNPDDAAAMAVGLKMLGEIVLENRDNPLFADLSQGIKAFIMKLKSGGAAKTN